MDCLPFADDLSWYGSSHAPTASWFCAFALLPLMDVLVLVLVYECTACAELVMTVIERFPSSCSFARRFS